VQADRAAACQGWLPAAALPGAATGSGAVVSFTIHGIGVSGGIAIGRAQLVSHATLEVAHYAIPAAKVRAEVARFEAAVNEVQKELETLHGSMSGDDVPANSARSSTCTG